MQSIARAHCHHCTCSLHSYTMASVYGLLAGAISLVVFGVVVATGFDWSRFSYHPVAMTAGMVVCAPLALEAMRTQRVQTRVEDRYRLVPHMGVLLCFGLRVVM